MLTDPLEHVIKASLAQLVDGVPVIAGDGDVLVRHDGDPDSGGHAAARYTRAICRLGQVSDPLDIGQVPHPVQTVKVGPARHLVLS